MRIISRKPIIEFLEKHPKDQPAFYAWYNDVKHANWSSWTDLKQSYPTADSIGNDRYVFNIKRNNYRIVVLVKFIQKIIYIRFVGTHKEYDKINAKEA